MKKGVFRLATIGMIAGALLPTNRLPATEFHLHNPYEEEAVAAGAGVGGSSAADRGRMAITQRSSSNSRAATGSSSSISAARSAIRRANSPLANCSR